MTYVLVVMLNVRLSNLVFIMYVVKVATPNRTFEIKYMMSEVRNTFYKVISQGRIQDFKKKGRGGGGSLGNC